MEKLISSWCKDQSVLPQSYIYPPDKRPGNLVVPKSNNVPVIDIGSNHNRADIVQQVLKASQEFGLFQVVNHGVPEQIISDTMSVMEEFFELPVEEKASLFSAKKDSERRCKLITSTENYDHENVHLWRDNLKHPIHPLEECIQFWPEKPTRYREIIAAYVIEVKKLGFRMLELLCQGLSIDTDYFEGKLSEDMLLSVNHYPPCPDPTLTLGVGRHCDPGILAILLQGHVSGLQVFKDGEWIGVQPLPNAFVINIGYMLQVISNNKVKSGEHRAVTNASDARTSVVMFIHPCKDSMIEPAKSCVSESNPPMYRAFPLKDFMTSYLSLRGQAELALEPFKLQT